MLVNNITKDVLYNIRTSCPGFDDSFYALTDYMSFCIGEESVDYTLIFYFMKAIEDIKSGNYVLAKNKLDTNYLEYLKENKLLILEQISNVPKVISLIATESVSKDFSLFCREFLSIE